MKLYLSIIGAAMAIISLVNGLCQTAPLGHILFLTVLCTALQFALDGLIAILVHKMPDSLFRGDRPFYRVTEAEMAFYKRIHVRAWKDRVWELGGLGGFSKKHLAEPGSIPYVERFLLECHKGVLTHRLSYPIGFLPMLFIPGVCAFTVALPVAVVNLFLNILPTVVLRYNTPKLMTLLSGMRRRAARAEEKNSAGTTFFS